MALVPGEYALSAPSATETGTSRLARSTTRTMRG